jgi:hypothetical protein
MPQIGRWLSREPLGENESANLYTLARNDAVNHHDFNGLYDEAGHFYTTYLAARAAGFNDARAFNIAKWSQYPDEDANYDAMRKLTWGHAAEIDIQPTSNRHVIALYRTYQFPQHDPCYGVGKKSAPPFCTS